VTRYESSPCISGDNLSTENGGRIEFLPPASVLLTIGSNKLELLESGPTLLDGSSYGKIIELDTGTWTASVFTRGHRNPQGLLVADGVVWSTEHGPFGGDEINLVRRGEDYGWPLSTYGTAYGGKSWPMIEGPHEHSIGTPPIYAWIPSIGVSNLIQLRGSAFPAWQGDLMVGSLSGLGNGQSLYRIRMLDGRVVFAERIVTGKLVRDLVELADGRLLLWEGLTTLQLVEPAAHVFAPCAACHAVRYNNHGVGPDLMGILGARVARWQDFAYSDALESFGGRWTTQRLDAFLRDPVGTVPGTKMEIPGIADPAQRAAIIEYLDEARPPAN
jgi:cytochrome c2